MSSYKIIEALKVAGLLGSKLVPANFDPSATLHVQFHDVSVRLGNKLRVQETQKEPNKVNWYLDERVRPSHTLTLVMLDADAPTHETPFLHWAQSGLFADGGPHHPSLAPYAPPSPFKGEHRIVFLLYQEPLPEEVKKPGVELPGEHLVRASFDIEEFVKSNKLHLISADFFYCQGDQE